jgi:ATP-dependent Clp protease adapter protein ClpS
MWCFFVPPEVRQGLTVVQVQEGDDVEKKLEDMITHGRRWTHKISCTHPTVIRSVSAT